MWRYLHAEYGIGQLDGLYLHLGSEDHNYLRTLIKAQTGLDLLEPLPVGDRRQIAQHTGNEKLFAHAPSRHHLLLNSPADSLLVNGMTIPFLTGASYRLDWRTITEYPATVIVVENQQAFDFIQLAQIPAELRSAWVVYRGHSISSRAVIDFLMGAPAATRIIAFCDYDPDGLAIALTTTGATELLLPELSGAFIGAAGTRGRFDLQHAALAQLEQMSLPAELAVYLDRLKVEKHCVSQEIMLAKGMPLVCVPLSSVATII